MNSMRAPAAPSDPLIEPAFVALRDLFTGPLAQVSFPDVDAAAVGATVDELCRRAAALESARAALAAAQRDVAMAEQALRDQRAASIEQGQLALAYARVYAKSDRALVASIESITLPKQRAVATPSADTARAASAAPRRRGRPPKSATASDETTNRDSVAAE